MPSKRKRAATQGAQYQDNPAKKARSRSKVNGNNEGGSNAESGSKASNDDTAHSILGGLKGGYRITGDEPDHEAGKSTLRVPFNDKSIICERRWNTSDPTSQERRNAALIFTHGAGGGISNPATASFAQGFSNVSEVVCFQGTMNLQSRVKTFHAVLEHEHEHEHQQHSSNGSNSRGSGKTALGGRSMGARAAVITALESEEQSVAGLVLVSYPLVGASRGEARDGILKDLGDDTEVLFVIGSQDSMCDIAHLNRVRAQMVARSWLVEVTGADHGMSLKAKKGVEPVRLETGVIAAEWLGQRNRESTYCSVRWDEDIQEVVRSSWTTEQGENKGNASTKKKPPTNRRAKK